MFVQIEFGIKEVVNYNSRMIFAVCRTERYHAHSGKHVYSPFGGESVM